MFRDRQMLLISLGMLPTPKWLLRQKVSKLSMTKLINNGMDDNEIGRVWLEKNDPLVIGT